MNEHCKNCLPLLQYMQHDACPGFSLIEVLVVLALTGLLASLTVVAFDDFDDPQPYEETLETMLEIKQAIIGKPGLYCNGWKQFTGYVPDMGVMPAFLDDTNQDSVYEGQPRALWTRDLDNDGEITGKGTDIQDDFVWKYHEDEKIWAGWRGPYIEPPLDGVLKDGWGNPIMFIKGEVVTIDNLYYGGQFVSGVFRCKENWAGSDADKPAGFVYSRNSIDLCWVPFSQGPETDPPETYNSGEKTLPSSIFYGEEDALTIASFGADGEPGGESLDRDIVLTIYRTDWTGEVAGHAGYSGDPYVGRVTLCYPAYGQDPFIQQEEISSISNNDKGYGIHFRFGTAAEVGDDSYNFKNFARVSVPMGIRSIHSDTGNIYVFTVEPTGNWVGTVR